MTTKESNTKTEFLNLMEFSSHATIQVHFPIKLKEAVLEMYKMTIKERKVPIWPMMSYLDAGAASNKSEMQRSKSHLSQIEMSSPLRRSAGFVIESAKVYIDGIKSDEGEKRFTSMCFSFLKELFGIVIPLGLASSPEEHDFLINQQRIVMSQAKKNPLKDFNDTQLFYDHVRRHGAPCRQTLSYLLCFLPADYFLRFLTMLPKLMSHYANLYKGYVEGALSQFSVIVDMILCYMDENVQLGKHTECYKISSDSIT